MIFFNTLFLDFQFVLVFLDDIIIIGCGTYEEHMEQVKEVLGQFLKAGFQVHPEKSYWAMSQVEYHFFLIFQEGI